MKRKTKNRQKQSAVRPAVFLFLAVSVWLSGCGESKEAKTARLQGIEQMGAGNYGEAVASFETALSEADGIVDAFELDILQYRGEAEYLLEDYAAAAHTYGILEQVDGGKAEYLYYKAAAEAMSGSLEAAEADYQKAGEAAGISEEGKSAAAGAALTALSEAAREAKDAEKAMAFCQMALDSGMAGPEILNQMGLSLMEAGRLDEAVSYFEQALSQAEGETAGIVTCNMAAAYEKKSDFSRALELLKGYQSAYGSTPEVEKEIAFLESR